MNTLIKRVLLVTLLQLIYSIGYCQDDYTIEVPLRGVYRDSVVLSVGEIHVLNQKMIELEMDKLKIEQYELQINDYKDYVRILDNKVVKLNDAIERCNKNLDREKKKNKIYKYTTYGSSAIIVVLLILL